MANWRREPIRVASDWVVFRHGAVEASPVWSDFRPQPAARWHRLGSFAQYLSLQPGGAWAEFVSHQAVTPDIRESSPRCLWRLWVSERDVADLSTAARIAEAGLVPATFTDFDTYEECQQLAADLVDAGFRGLLSPSAALPSCTNLTLFGPRLPLEVSAWASEAVPENRAPDEVLIVERLADPAYVPAAILPRTRYR